MNDIEICKKCIYYEYALFGHCQLIEQLCINNCEFIDADSVISRYIEHETSDNNQLSPNNPFICSP